MKKIFVTINIVLACGLHPVIAQEQAPATQPASATTPTEMKVEWMHTSGSEPELIMNKKGKGKYVKKVTKDTLRKMNYAEVKLKRTETRIGHSEKPPTRLRLNITVITTHKIYRDFTEVEYTITTEPPAFLFTKSDSSVNVKINVDGKLYRIDLGIKKAEIYNAKEVTGKVVEGSTGNDIILHSTPVKEKDLKKLKNVKNFSELRTRMNAHYPSTTPMNLGQPDSGGGTSLQSRTLPYDMQPYYSPTLPQYEPKPGKLSFMAGGFAGAGNRLLRVNRAQYNGDKAIKDRNAAETALSSFGGHLGLGLNIKKSHTLALEFLYFKEGFKSSEGVDWSTGNMAPRQAMRYKIEYLGGGLSYYYMPRYFLFQAGFYYTGMRNPREYGGYFSKNAWIGKLMIGYSNRMSSNSNFFIAPTLHYNFTPLNKAELMTKLFAYGITAGIRLFKHKK